MSTSRTLTGGQLIARALQMEGVKNVFTLAGDHILPVLDVMGGMDFRFIDTRHEQAAVHMADAWGRITGQPGVAMYTTPGFANAIPGLEDLADMTPGGVEFTKRDAADIVDRAVRRRIVELVFVAKFGVQQLCASADRRMPAAASGPAANAIAFPGLRRTGEYQRAASH